MIRALAMVLALHTAASLPAAADSLVPARFLDADDGRLDLSDFLDTAYGSRYLIARKHGLHMGLDVAAGPDKPIFYVVSGSQWLRP